MDRYLIVGRVDITNDGVASQLVIYSCAECFALVAMDNRELHTHWHTANSQHKHGLML